MLAVALLLIAVDPVAVRPAHDDVGRDPVVETVPPGTAPAAPVVAPPAPVAPTSTKPTVPPRAPKTVHAHYRQHALVYRPPPGTGTPLVLSFAGPDAHVAWMKQSDARSSLEPLPFEPFPFEPGSPVHSAWPSPSTPWLVRDLDANNAIDSGREMFGSFTMLSDDVDPQREHRARNGFEALAALDANHDGVVDARDPAFPSLALWRDENGDRRVEPGELEPLDRAGVDALHVDGGVGDVTCGGSPALRHCERERAGFTWHDESGAHSGAIIDVHLELEAAPRPRS